MTQILHCGPYRLVLDRPLVMGIVNLTPDSFSDDGLGSDVERAVEHARRQWEAGADILDLGAESSRPGAIPTPEDEELRRLLPVIERIAAWGVPISVDTYKPRVMRAALAAGATLYNDISGLRDPESFAVLRDSDCGVCIMHMQGVPGSMQSAPSYQDVVGEVWRYLAERVAACQAAGVETSRIILDPGFGFGKTVEHNVELFKALPRYCKAESLPVLVGVSRKSMLGAITGRPVDSRLPASLAAAVVAAESGAKILRVHDVAATCDALKVWAALREGDNNGT